MTVPAAPQRPPKYTPRFFFDFGFGVLAPPLLLILDPLIFKGASYLPTGGLLAPIKIGAYTAIALGISAMALWLIYRGRLRVYSAYLLGIMGIGQAIAFAFAALLLPLSIIGVITAGSEGVGILGLVPIFTVFVFDRQRLVVRAYANARVNRKRAALIGAIAVIAISLFLQCGTWLYVNGAIRDLLNNPESPPRAVNQLKYAFWCGDECFYDLVSNYHKADNDPIRQQYLAAVYHDITNGDIRTKIFSYFD